MRLTTIRNSFSALAAAVKSRMPEAREEALSERDQRRIELAMNRLRLPL